MGGRSEWLTQQIPAQHIHSPFCVCGAGGQRSEETGQKSHGTYGAYPSDICDVLTLDYWLDGNLILNPPATQVSTCMFSIQVVLTSGPMGAPSVV